MWRGGWINVRKSAVVGTNHSRLGTLKRILASASVTSGQSYLHFTMEKFVARTTLES